MCRVHFASRRACLAGEGLQQALLSVCRRPWGLPQSSGMPSWAQASHTLVPFPCRNTKLPEEVHCRQPCGVHLLPAMTDTPGCSACSNHLTGPLTLKFRGSMVPGTECPRLDSACSSCIAHTRLPFLQQSKAVKELGLSTRWDAPQQTSVSSPSQNLEWP